MLSRAARLLAPLSLFTALAAAAFGQVPEGIIVVKGPGFRQTSPTAQESYLPGFAIIVLFPGAVPATTSINVTGPGVSLPVPRVTPDTYMLERYLETEAALDREFPDGNYSVTVSGGGPTSTAALVVPPGAGIRPPRITNYTALQSWSTTPLRIEWEPIAGGTSEDMLILSVARMDGTEIYSSPTLGESGALSGASTGLTLPALDMAPGETLMVSLTYAKLSVGFANNNQTITAVGRGVFLYFSIARALPSRPIITLQPRAQNVTAGSTVALSVTATGATSYQWRRNGVPLTGATGPTFVLTNVQASTTGFYTVDVINVSGSVTSDSIAVNVVAATEPSRISNLAIRSSAGTGAQTLIVGLSIGGAGTSGTKPLLLRGVGPALAGFGVPGTLADPRLEVYSGQTRINENDNWEGNAQVASISAQVGAFALGGATTRDAALYNPQFSSPGSYSIQVTGNGGSSGIALAEIYDATPSGSFAAGTPRLVNVSARTQVGTGGDILIAGFVIGGTTSKTVLVRAIGPTLASFGVPSALLDPKLDVFSGSSLVQSNDNWDQALASSSSSVGAFPLFAGSRDAAVLVTLPPGSYTAQVSGVNNTTGVALVEVYEVP